MQIAEYLGAKLNPERGYEDDLCIYVKPFIDTKFAKNFYVDVVDGRTLFEWLIANPQIKIISCSQYNYEFLQSRLKGNKIIFIPQHHCNFERFKRNREQVINVGFIGSPGSFMFPFEEMRRRIESKGMTFIYKTIYSTRQEVFDFYKNIDIQISWRTIQYPFKNPLRFINAASFGIPTVGYPEICNKEFEGYYIQVKTIDHLIKEVRRLRDDPDYYKEFSNKIFKKANDYHISKIAKMYKKLKR
ncbi:MAG: hypothetical protein A2163_07900 [Actinobacteria bacterium RBG_13_35_12]|nr:MAG: hypothetical protein A2163_07900 [Actinobacteria bacterium RBG_13_35_12]